MMPQRFRRAESGEKRDAFDRLIGRLQQALRERQAFAEQPAADRRSGQLAKVAGKRTPTQQRSFRQTVQAVRVLQIRPHPVDQVSQTGVAGGYRHGLFDELRLASPPMRWNDQTARHAVGRFGAVPLAQHVQATIDSGGSTCRGQDVAVVDVEDAGIQMHLRIAPGEVLRETPVRGGPAPIQQAGLGQHVGTETQADNLCATAMGGEQRGKQRLRRSFVRVTPARDNDRVGDFQRLQSVQDEHIEPGRRRQEAGWHSVSRHPAPPC